MAADETFDVLLRVKSEGDEQLKQLSRAMVAVQTETKKTAAALQQTGQSANGFRSGLQNLGFQAQDFAVQVGGGTSALRAFSQQMPQAIGAMQGMFGATSKLGAFLGGPWGVALGVAAAALGPLITQLFAAEDAAKDAKKELENFSTWEGLGAQAAKANALAVNINKLQEQLDKLPSGPSKEAKAFAATTDEGKKLTRQINEQTAAYNKLNPAVQQQLELLRRSDALKAGLTEGDKRRAAAVKAAAAADKAPRTKTDDAADKAAADLLARSLATVGDAFRKMDEEAKAAQKTQDDFIKTLERAADPSKAFAEELGKLFDLYEQNKISQEAYDLAVRKSMDTLSEAVGQINDNPAARKIAENQKAAAKEVEDAWAGVGDSISDAFGQLVAKTSSVRDVVRSLVADILQQLAKIAVKKFVAKVLTSAATASAKGNVFDSKGMVPFASGGVVTAPTIFPFAGGTGLMGEKGPEAIMPLQRDAQGKLGVAAAPVSVNVINNAGAAVSVQETGPGQIEIFIARAVEASRSAIAQDFRRGGSDVARSVERTYGINRAAGAF